ncbi:hypothetical protein [Corynebacterium pseudodiphtheriticum]|uniref:hypothetical protein n=1 Tax=Corynebacterium pseudodiphtheriticum TaxID=37637 RepID=UPI003AF23669
MNWLSRPPGPDQTHTPLFRLHEQLFSKFLLIDNLPSHGIDHRLSQQSGRVSHGHLLSDHTEPHTPFFLQSHDDGKHHVNATSATPSDIIYGPDSRALVHEARLAQRAVTSGSTGQTKEPAETGGLSLDVLSDNLIALVEGSKKSFMVEVARQLLQRRLANQRVPTPNRVMRRHGPCQGRGKVRALSRYLHNFRRTRTPDIGGSWCWCEGGERLSELDRRPFVFADLDAVGESLVR